MKKYLLIIVFLLIITGCNKKYQMTCSGDIDMNNERYKLNVTINYDINDKVESLDYEMIYDNVDLFNKACEESKDKDPICEDMKVKYTEKDEITTSFSKDDIKNMLYIIGATECE